MVKNTDTQVIIIGAGMAGLSLAGLLSQQGLAVTVIDQQDPGLMGTRVFDKRTIALSDGTLDILSPLGVVESLKEHSAAIKKIDVQEGFDPFLLQFDAQEVGADAFGWIAPNFAVRKLLYEACCHTGVQFVTGSSVTEYVSGQEVATITLGNGKTYCAPLVVAADGRHSMIRRLCGIDTVELAYHHTAYVGFMTHSTPHNGLAVERFYPSGPFAILPFTDTDQGLHQSAVVWSFEEKQLKQEPFSVADLVAITKRLQPVVGDRYGTIQATGEWAGYPLSLVHAKSMIAPRTVFISDAAHAIHPIAGQGLNLGMRDVAYIAKHLPDYFKATKIPDIDGFIKTYQRARRFDVLQMVAATDILTRLFGIRAKPVRWARSVGLGLVNHVPPLKRFFMRQAMGR